jgi:hypothetical protein
MQAAQESAQASESTVSDEADEASDAAALKLCANCWNAVTFKDDGGRHMARCAKDLWVKPAVTVEELNSNRLRRWYGDCPEYDDSE